MLKLLPRGVVQLVASAPSPLGSVSSISDWAGGRSLEAEEHRLGMLCRVRTTSDRPMSAASSGQALTHHSPPPLQCVVKCDVADWQVNELDADGATVFLRSRLKAQWRKMEKRKTHLVEDNSNESFTDPNKTFTPKVQHHGLYVRKLGQISAERPLLGFTVYRENTSVAAMKQRLQSEARIDADAVELFDCASGYQFGCVTQRGTAIGVSPLALVHGSRHYSLHSLLFDPDSPMLPVDQLGLLRRPPAGTLFRVMLRCVSAKGDQSGGATIAAALERLASRGFVNYFDAGRFGIGSTGLHETAACLLQTRDLQRACAQWLHREAEKHSVHYQNYISYINADASTTRGVVAMWRQNAYKINSSRQMMKFLEQLERMSGNAADTALLEELSQTAFPDHGPYFRSAAEFLWNAMVSQRLMTYGLRVCVGDIVANGQLRRRVHSPEDARKFTIFDVACPVLYGTERGEALYPGHDVGAAFCKDFCAQHKLDFLLQGTPTLDAGGGSSVAGWHLRHIVARPENLRHIAVPDPNSYAVAKTDLFMAQERLPLSADGNLQQRLREPCVFNVSDAFIEKMKPILARRRLGVGADSATHSVLVSFVLPHGSFASSALREVCDMSYATFHDLLR
jgi:tRNA(Glu) U13 pseudouridine synthase TruD